MRALVRTEQLQVAVQPAPGVPWCGAVVLARACCGALVCLLACSCSCGRPRWGTRLVFGLFPLFTHFFSATH
ncbi:hypothetical protein V5799_029928 [Amblyomma americanum]|uniref:Uncharacterized protein n=1 Tax=Amblyomma americanum TaxID=6943 RepID=A0AAQ4EPV8_AMBAM